MQSPDKFAKELSEQGYSNEHILNALFENYSITELSNYLIVVTPDKNPYSGTEFESAYDIADKMSNALFGKI